MAAALPQRSWEAIRKNCSYSRQSIKVPETGFLSPSDTILDYLEANSETATTMPFAISKNYSPEIKSKEQAPPRRFNIAKLQLDSFILVSQLYEALNKSNPDNKNEDR